MGRRLALLSIIIAISYALYNTSRDKKVTPKVVHTSKAVENDKQKALYRDELTRVDDIEYVKEYIIDVINHGSNKLSFKGGVMEGGYISSADAPILACYVLALSKKVELSSCPQEASMFYSSVCGGCHGDDGRGIHGTYPDLTRDRLLGVSHREEWLRAKLRQK